MLRLVMLAAAAALLAGCAGMWDGGYQQTAAVPADADWENYDERAGSPIANRAWRWPESRTQ